MNADFRDVCLMLGLVLLSGGFALIHAPLALIVPGAVLTGISIFGVRR